MNAQFGKSARRGRANSKKNRARLDRGLISGDHAGRTTADDSDVRSSGARDESASAGMKFGKQKIDEGWQIHPPFARVEDGALRRDCVGIDARRHGSNFGGAKQKRVVADLLLELPDRGDPVCPLVRVPCEAAVEAQPCRRSRLRCGQRPITVDTGQTQAVVRRVRAPCRVQPRQRPARGPAGGRAIVDNGHVNAKSREVERGRDPENAGADDDNVVWL